MALRLILFSSATSKASASVTPTGPACASPTWKARSAQPVGLEPSDWRPQTLTAAPIASASGGLPLALRPTTSGPRWAAVIVVSVVMGSIPSHCKFFFSREVDVANYLLWQALWFPQCQST